MFAIEINQLTKKFGDFTSIQDIHLQIEHGEIFGFLGPNGAGKSTTIRHLMGFIRPTEGTCSMNGLDCLKDAAEIQKKIGYLPGEIAFFDKMTGTQFIQFIGKMKGLQDFSRAEELIHFFELDPSRSIRKMSKGMKQKVGLVCAFMHKPEIVILDEPTSGLDPLMQTKFIEFILEEKKRGTTVFMSSHMIEEVEKTCDRVAIISKGKLVAVDKVSDLKERKIKKYVVTFGDEKQASRFIQEDFISSPISSLDISVQIQGNIQAFIKCLANYDVKALDVVTQSLEEVFLDYYKDGGNPL
ncbi:ABC transporter ATP-binding protein [Lysinibacillus sp. 54212]|uniref:ABC transporter ATP-binding protein n=1 Tax=Lysinibacillus sp. 54212 TaxID=3119829 RepID=UPI002FCBCE16